MLVNILLVDLDPSPASCLNNHSMPPPHPVKPQPITHPATVPPCVCTHPAPILQHGRWEDTPRHLRHVIVHHYAELLQVGVRAPDHAVALYLGWGRQCECEAPVGVWGSGPPAPHQPADLLLPVGGGARRGFDHGGCLVVRQLLDAALAGNDVADLQSTNRWVQELGTRYHGNSKAFSHLQGEIGVLLLLPHLQAGQVWILELKVVFLLEVLSHRALHGLPVLQLQREPGRKCACVRKMNPTRPMEHGGAAYV